MRVALVVRGGVDRSGRERVIPAMLSLVERLARRVDLHVFALQHERQPATYQLLGATVHDLGHVRAARPWRRRAQARRLLAALRDAGAFDVIHAYWATPAGHAATTAARALGVPSIVTADSGEWVALPDIQYGLQRRWIDRRAVAATMRAATRVTVCTEFMAALASRHDVRADVIPLGTVVADLPHLDRNEQSPRRLLHVASINRVKDHPTLLRALRIVVDREPRTHLDIVGEDTLGGATQRLAEELGVSAQVTFHGFQPTPAVSRLYARADVHVVSSRHEAAGVVVLEAAAHGVPTVGTRVGYVADWASQGRAAAVPVGDAAALAEEILSLFADRGRRDRIAAAARRWTTAHDADWTAAQFDALYRELGTHPRSRA